MHASSTHQFQIARGFSLLPACAIGRPACSSRRGRAAAFNNPERPYSLPAGGRSLMGGCASRRQTRAQGGVLALHRNRAIRPTRHFNQRQRSSGTALGNGTVAGRGSARLPRRVFPHQFAVEVRVLIPLLEHRGTEKWQR